MVDIDPVESCGVAEAKIRDLYLPVGVYFMATVTDTIDERVLIEAEKVTSLGEEVEVASFVMGILQELGGSAETSCIRQVGEREEAASVLSFVGDEVAVSREVGLSIGLELCIHDQCPFVQYHELHPQDEAGELLT